MPEILSPPSRVVPPPQLAGRRRPRAAGWDLLLGCVAVYVAMSVGRIHQLFPILMPLKPALVSAMVAIALLLLQQSRDRRLGLLRSRTTFCLLGLVAWAGLAVTDALNQGVAFEGWTDLVRTVAMCLVLAGSVRGIRDVERLVQVYFVVTVVYTVVVLSRFHLGSDSWRLGHLYHYDANDLATLIVSAMSLGIYFVLGQRRLVMRLLALGGVGVLAVGLIRTGSRGGFLALVVVAAFVLLFFTTVPARSRVVGLVAILGIVWASASDRYWTQMQTMLNPDHDYNTTEDAGRLKIWTRGIGYMAEHPLLGVGASNFPVAEGTISPLARRQERGVGVRWGAAHNSFVQIGAELGVPGLLLFLGVIGSALVSLRRVAQAALTSSPPARQMSRLAQSVMAALVGFAVGAFFLSLAYADMLYTLAAFAIALAKTSRLRGPTPL